jgi:hypothetical protein
MNWHKTDALSLGFGLAFLAIAAWWQLLASVDLDLPELGWFVAGILIFGGLLGAVVSLRHHGPDPADRTELHPSAQHTDRRLP